MREEPPRRRSWRQHVAQWVRHNKTLIVRSLVVVAAVFIAVQLLYPGSRLLPFASIDDIAVGGKSKADAVQQLNSTMQSQDIAIRLGDTSNTYEYVRPSEVGLVFENNQRVQQVEYPWYLRLVPASILWYGPLQSAPPAQTQVKNDALMSYLEQSVGKTCEIPPKNASLAYNDGSLEIIAAKNGGECETNEVVAAFKQLRPRYNESIVAQLPVKRVEPNITDQAAKDLKTKLEQATKSGITFTVNGTKQTIKQAELFSWLSFSAKNKQLIYIVDKKKAKQFTDEITKKVVKPAGTSYIKTRDYTVVSEKVGATGKTLAVDATLSDIKQVVEGAQDTAKAFVASVKPKVEYTRTYTKTSTGIAALLQHYAEDNNGSFGVSFSELSGRGLSASYNSSQRFTTASTYKLFVAYGTVRKVDAGKWKWSDKNIAGGRNLATCFNDMIVKSDNPCAEALLDKLGLTQLTKDIASLGLYNSGFTLGNTPLTTAADLSLLLTKLKQDKLPIKSDSRTRWLNAMERNVYRQGIPAGTSGAVADKVGFLNGLLHDAAIVTSSKGDYVLVILTDGSSWANIAELTKKIESLR